MNRFRYKIQYIHAAKNNPRKITYSVNESIIQAHLLVGRKAEQVANEVHRSSIRP